MSKRVTQIPFPGNSGVTPTGAMQFQGDWPGVFIRGDHAFNLRLELQELLAIAREQSKRPSCARHHEQLRRCRVARAEGLHSKRWEASICGLLGEVERQRGDRE